MCHAFLRDASFWSFLLEVDRDVAEEAREGRCGTCESPLHCAHYRRKPRGIEVENLGAEFFYRLSFCCGREGCRRRLTPPSVRFLGAKVYLGAIVVLVTAMRQGPTPPGMRKLRSLFGADRRTVARWQKLWREVFPSTKFWAVAKAHFMPPVDDGKIPNSLMERFEEATIEKKLQAVLQFLAGIRKTVTFSVAYAVAASLPGAAWKLGLAAPGPTISSRNTSRVGKEIDFKTFISYKKQTTSTSRRCPPGES